MGNSQAVKTENDSGGPRIKAEGRSPPSFEDLSFENLGEKFWQRIILAVAVASWRLPPAAKVESP